jgi:hypothetical protein
MDSCTWSERLLCFNCSSSALFCSSALSSSAARAALKTPAQSANNFDPASCWAKGPADIRPDLPVAPSSCKRRCDSSAFRSSCFRLTIILFACSPRASKIAPASRHRKALNAHLFQGPVAFLRLMHFRCPQHSAARPAHWSRAARSTPRGWREQLSRASSPARSAH